MRTAARVTVIEDDMRYIARTDANQAEIVAALRGVGASVCLLHTVGRGCPDVLVGFRGANYLLEIKTASGTLTEDERRFFDEWNGEAVVVRTVQEALEAVGAV